MYEEDFLTMTQIPWSVCGLQGSILTGALVVRFKKCMIPKSNGYLIPEGTPFIHKGTTQPFLLQYYTLSPLFQLFSLKYAFF